MRGGNSIFGFSRIIYILPHFGGTKGSLSANRNIIKTKTMKRKEIEKRKKTARKTKKEQKDKMRRAI